jgi:broad-specificity NMP kinase
MAACLYINGYPGVGKLTIAKELSLVSRVRMKSD